MAHPPGHKHNVSISIHLALDSLSFMLEIGYVYPNRLRAILEAPSSGPLQPVRPLSGSIQYQASLNTQPKNPYTFAVPGSSISVTVQSYGGTLRVNLVQGTLFEAQFVVGGSVMFGPLAPVEGPRTQGGGTGGVGSNPSQLTDIVRSIHCHR